MTNIDEAVADRRHVYMNYWQVQLKFGLQATTRKVKTIFNKVEKMKGFVT